MLLRTLMTHFVHSLSYPDATGDLVNNFLPDTDYYNFNTFMVKFLNRSLGWHLPNTSTFPPMNRKQRRAAEARNRQPLKTDKHSKSQSSLAEQAIDVQAKLFEALQLHKAGNLLGAEQGYRQVIALRPNIASAHNALGAALQAQGRHDDALQAFNAALEIDPSLTEAKNNKINLLSLMGQPETPACVDNPTPAVQEVSILGGDGEAAGLFNGANALKAKGDLAQAAELYTQAIRLDPRHARAYANLGDTFITMGTYDAAEAMIRASLLFEPDNAESLNALGVALINQGKLNDATNSFESSLKIRPHNISTLTNLGNAYKDCRQIDKSIDTYRQALAIAPTVEVHSNVLMAMHYSSKYSREEIFQEHRLWNEIYAAPLQPRSTSFKSMADREKRLRVGFVSGSFHRHPVGYLTISALEALNRETMEVVLYSTNARQDDLTERFKATADQWVSIVGTPDENFAQQVRRDKVDILIDLAGHSDGFRLLAFARRAAPVQIKWVGGQFNTTGMDAMDYFLSDSIETPEGDDKWYSEKVIRMPDGYVCYDPPFYAPDVTALPALKQGYITFGCFNYATKITEDVVKLWSQLLNTIEDSRLILKSKPYNDAANRQSYIDMFSAQGIDPARVELRGSSPHDKLLAEYGEIDIALDPFPYSGGLTTIEALWMGVPVITMPGQTFAARHAASHITNAGLGNWLCDSPETYLERAHYWSTNLENLSQLRGRLRDQVSRSPLCDAPRFAGHFEDRLREIWVQWCQAQSRSAA